MPIGANRFRALGARNDHITTTRPAQPGPRRQPRGWAESFSRGPLVLYAVVERGGDKEGESGPQVMERGRERKTCDIFASSMGHSPEDIL